MILGYILKQLESISPKGDLYGEISHRLWNVLFSSKRLTIEEAAEECDTSISSISRFSRMLEYRNYSEISVHIADFDRAYRAEGFLCDTLSDEPDAVLGQYHQNMMNALEKIHGISPEALLSCADVMKSSERLFVFGSPIPQGVYFLLMELERQGVETFAHLYPRDQFTEIGQMRDTDTALIFDCTSSENLTDELMRHHNGKGRIILYAQQQLKYRMYKPDHFFCGPDMGLNLNMIAAGELINQLIVLLQLT